MWNTDGEGRPYTDLSTGRHVLLDAVTYQLVMDLTDEEVMELFDFLAMAASLRYSWAGDAIAVMIMSTRPGYLIAERGY